MAIIKIRNAAIDLDAAEIPNLPATKITSGTLATARLGSGTASSTTFLAGDQTYKTAATEFNDDKLVNDISTLALHQATNNNSAKYNLTNSNVDVYQDSSAIANLVNTARNTTGEYISTAVEGADAVNTPTAIAYGSNFGATGGTSLARTIDGNSGLVIGYTTSNTTSNSYITIDLGSVKTIKRLDLGKVRYNGDVTQFRITYSASSSNADTNAPDLSSATTAVLFQNNNDAPITGMNSSGYGTWAAITNSTRYCINKVEDFPSFSARYLRMAITAATFHDNNAALNEFATYSPSSVTSATGNYQSTAQTANASVNKISGVVTYTNASGTATLNTDIILQVSADNGSNYTNATLTAAGTFSTGVLQAVTNDISVTAGTQLKYKILFANQSAGSKVARINGVSLSY